MKRDVHNSQSVLHYTTFFSVF